MTYIKNITQIAIYALWLSILEEGSIFYGIAALFKSTHNEF